MEWESDSPCHGHMYSGQGRRYPRRHSSWEPELRVCGTIPRQGLMLTVERWTKGRWGRRLRWETPVEESRQSWKEDNIAESYVVGGAITIASLSPHASISSWTTERLAHQAPDTLNYRVGPHPRYILSAWCTDMQSRTPAMGAPLYAWHAKQQRKTPGKGAL